MFSLLRTLSLGYLGQHRTRSALVMLSIALGVSTLLATQSLNQGLGKAAEVGSNPMASLADLLITTGDGGVPLALADEIDRAIEAETITGIEQVQPVVLGRVAVADLDNRLVWLLGIDWERMRKADAGAATGKSYGLEVESTFTPRNWTERLAMLFVPIALVNAKLSDDLEAKVGHGKPFAVRMAGRQPNVLAVGKLKVDSKKLPLEGDVIVLDIHAAAALAYPEKPGTVHQIGIKLEQGAARDGVLAALRELVGDRAQVTTVEANRAIIADVMSGLKLGFDIGGACALVIGLFLVYNALSVSVAERRHDIGILRSVGATRPQIAGLFVGEAAILGLLGSLVGVPIGYALAWVAVKPIARLMSELLVPVTAVPISFPPSLLLLAILAGMGTAVLAALVPAILASREEPADAVRRVPLRQGLALFLAQGLAAALLVLVGVLLVNLRRQLPPQTGMYAGIVCLMLAGLVVTPLLAALVGRAFQPLFRYLLGLEGRLAADNLVRAPGRTGLVIAALAATSGLLVQTAGVRKSTETALTRWVDDKIAADLFVSGVASAASAGQGLLVREEIAYEIRKMAGVESVLPIRFHAQEYQKRFLSLVAYDTDAFDRAGHDRPIAKTLARYPEGRKAGKALVSENFLVLNNLRLGQTIEVQGAGKVHQLEIVGTVVDYSSNRGTVLVPRDWYKKEFGTSQLTVIDVFLKPGADAGAIKKAIEDRWGVSDAVVVIGRDALNSEIRGQLQKVYALGYAQQTIVGMVALLGVVSALFISVLQRRRELGLLRAVGATRAQVLYSVLAEAVLMGLIGAVVGFGIGMALEWYVLDVLLVDETGFTFPLLVPWVEAVALSLVAVVCATLAGLWPAYLATRLRITEAIAYE